MSDPVVEIIPAWVWLCPECDRKNVDVSDIIDMEVPVYVTCTKCGVVCETEIGGEIDIDA